MCRSFIKKPEKSKEKWRMMIDDPNEHYLSHLTSLVTCRISAELLTTHEPVTRVPIPIKSPQIKNNLHLIDERNLKTD